MKQIFILCGLVSLAGCGGGGGSDGGMPNMGAAPSDSQLLALTAGQTKFLTNIAIGSGGTIGTSNWTVTHPDQVTIGASQGSLDIAAGQVTFSGQNLVTLTNPATTEHVLMTQATAGATGVVGEATPSGTVVATGVAAYSGSGTAVVVDGAAVYTLTGSAAISVDFAGAGDVDIALSGLSGQRRGTSNSTVSGHNMRIDNATISGNQISGGTFSAPAGQYSPNPGSAGSFAHSGGFFGPGSAEIGGVAHYDETGNTTAFTATMTYIGKQ